MDGSVDELLKRQVARFVDRRADWDAFADARVEGFRRAQHRFIGAGASGKQDPNAKVFFVLRGKVLVFFEDAGGRRAEAVLGEWDCVSAPANVIHGFQNVGLEPAYMQVMLGRATPDLMQYTDAGLQARRDEHLKTR